MKNCSAAHIALGILLVAVGMSGAHAQIYKCKDASGVALYQQVPCAGAAQDRRLIAPASLGAPARSGDDGSAKLSVLLALGFKRYCDETIPGFAEQVSYEWSQWRDRNLRTIREVESDPGFMGHFRETPDQFANFKSGDARFVCTPQWVRDLVGDPQSNLLRFASTPESTWRHFIEALSRADRQEALNCYSMPSRPKYGRVLDNLSDDQLKNQAATWKLIGPPTGEANSREYFIQAGGKHAGTVWFYRFGGNWLMVEM